MRLQSASLLVLFGILSAPATPLVAQDHWSEAPVNTRAVVAVANMRSFSTKIDRAAMEMGLLQPGVLESAKLQSGIRNGLNETGPLLWFYGPPTANRSPVTYLLPASNHQRLIFQLKPKREGRFQKVTVGNKEFLTHNSGDFVGFANTEQSSQIWLETCLDAPGNGDRSLGELNGYLRDQDIGFALSPQGLKEGLKTDLPFSKGQYVVPAALEAMAVQFGPSQEITATAAGVKIQPDLDLVVSAAALLHVQGDVAQWSKSMKLNRDQLLRDVPDGELVFLVASSVADLWKQEITSLVTGPRSELRNHPENEKLLRTFDLSPLQGITAYARPTQNGEHWASTVFLQIHCDNASQCLNDLQKWVDLLLSDEDLDPRPNLRSEIVNGRKRLLMSLEEFRIPATLAVTVLNDHSMLFTLGGVESLKQGMEANERPERISDDPTNSVAYRILNPDDQMLALINVDLLSLWLLEVFQDTGAIETDQITQFMRLPAMFRDAPPIAIGNRFDKKIAVTEVAVSHQLLHSIGKFVRTFAPQFSAN